MTCFRRVPAKEENFLSGLYVDVSCFSKQKNMIDIDIGRQIYI
jgi:hypothetical protein